MNTLDHWPQDKLMLVISAILGSASAYGGAVMSEGQARWMLVAFGSAVLCAAILSIGFRKPDETGKVVVSRCFIATMIGVSIIKVALHQWDLAWLDKDIVALILATNGATTFGYLIGYEVIVLFSKESGSISKWIFNWIIKKFTP